MLRVVLSINHALTSIYSHQLLLVTAAAWTVVLYSVDPGRVHGSSASATKTLIVPVGWQTCNERYRATEHFAEVQLGTKAQGLMVGGILSPKDNGGGGNPAKKCEITIGWFSVR